MWLNEVWGGSIRLFTLNRGKWGFPDEVAAMEKDGRWACLSPGSLPLEGNSLLVSQC